MNIDFYIKKVTELFGKLRGDFTEKEALELTKIVYPVMIKDMRIREGAGEEKEKEEREFEPATDRQISYAKDLGIDADFDKISKERLSELIDRKLKEKGGD